MNWLIWAGIVACLSPIWGALVWELWAGWVRPRLLAREVIRRQADAYLRRYGVGAEEMVFIEEDRAWRYSDSSEQGKWRRVRREIERLRKDRENCPYGECPSKPDDLRPEEHL